MSNPTLETLSAAYARIEDPAHWCQKMLARLPSGRGRAHFSDYSGAEVQWCAIGAIKMHERDAYLAGVALDEAALMMGYGNRRTVKRHAAYLNDNTDHATVLEMYQVAAALIEAEE